MASREAVLAGLALLSATYQNFKLTDASVEVWDSLLTDIPDELLAAAVKDCACRCKFPPSLAEIRDTAHRLTDDGITGEEAWLSFKAAMNHTIPWGELDPRVTEAIAGDPTWLAVHIREGNVSEPVVRAQFVRAYNAIRERERLGKTEHPEVRNLIEYGIERRQLALNAEERGDYDFQEIEEPDA